MSFHIRRTIYPRLFSTGRPKLSYIPWKTKEEILGLQDEDSTRWNASTLSTRFGAARENVEALLRLGVIRRERERILNSLGKDERERIVTTRDSAIKCWNQLIEGVPTGTMRRPARRPSELRGSTADAHAEVEVSAGQSTGADAACNTEGTGEEGTAAEAVDEVKNSTWATFLEREVDNFEQDVERRTTFAFIEIGDEKERLRRAVWIRECNGRMRIANEDERKLLLNEVRMKDSLAWRS